MSNIVILSGHPRAESFVEQLTNSYKQGAVAAGHKASLFKLHELNIAQDPIAPKPDGSDWSREMSELWEEMLNADHIVIAHPLWWGSMPGELKMLFDRFLVSGRAYSYEDGKAFPTGHLKGRTAEIIMTSDTPNWFYRWGYKSAQTQLMKNQILKFIGLKPTRFTHISPMRTMNLEQRHEQLEKAKQLGMSIKTASQSARAA